ncbi:MAG: 3-phosphoglycerate dehydrogenase [Saprospiraceae bacterium]|nr:3-phosphoglycerate dehydrogenase [Saprospiraceae bacterium]
MGWKIHINDGMESSGVQALKNAGFQVSEDKIEQEDLQKQIHSFDGIIIRSATKIRKEIIDAGTKLKFIARGGVGLDNVDVSYALQKGIQVINTPASSSISVAELAFAHMLSLSRGLQEHQTKMNSGESFTELKKKYSQSSEVSGKQLLLIGFGRIARELARMCLGLQMKITVHDPFLQKASLTFEMEQQKFQIQFPMVSLDEGIGSADFISIHAPFSGQAILGANEFSKMKKNAIVINTSRGENIDEVALIDALDKGIISGAGLDVFHGEPNVHSGILSHSKISKSPHIGASTIEAQERIANELVDQILQLYRQRLEVGLI